MFQAGKGALEKRARGEGVSFYLGVRGGLGREEVGWGGSEVARASLLGGTQAAPEGLHPRNPSVLGTLGCWSPQEQDVQSLEGCRWSRRSVAQSNGQRPGQSPAGHAGFSSSVLTFP